jgi:hypothetical protein
MKFFLVVWLLVAQGNTPAKVVLEDTLVVTKDACVTAMSESLEKAVPFVAAHNEIIEFHAECVGEHVVEYPAKGG